MTFFSLVAGAVMIALGVLNGGWALLLIWFGFSFLWLGVAHARCWHRAFGKRADGTLPAWSKLVHLPFLSYTWLIWHLLRVFSREPSQNEVTDQLVIGRRLSASELKGEFANIVDLTAEFEEPSALRQLPGYTCFPILDASAPTPEALRAFIAQLRPGKTYVHCAQGHGRTGLFALALLLANGTVTDVEDGLRLLTKARPAVYLNSTQRRCIEEYFKRLRR